MSQNHNNSHLVGSGVKFHGCTVEIQVLTDSRHQEPRGQDFKESTSFGNQSNNNSNNTKGHYTPEVSRPSTCEHCAKSGCHAGIPVVTNSNIKHQHSNGRDLGIVVYYSCIVLCVVVTIFTLGCSHYTLWSKYEYLKNSQLEINEKLGELQRQLDDCDGVNNIQTDVADGNTNNAADDVVDALVELNVVGEELLGRPDFLEQLEEDNTLAFGGLLEPEAQFPDNHGRFKRSDDPRASRGNKKRRGERNKRKGNKEPRKKAVKPSAVTFQMFGGKETNFDGKKFVDWELDKKSLSLDKYFSYSEGEVLVIQKGLYLIYSQITYYTKQLQTGYSVKRGSSTGDGEDPETILTCMTSMSANNTLHQSCYSAKPFYLEANDKVFVTDNYGEQGANITKMVNFQSHLSFWGLIKLS